MAFALEHHHNKRMLALRHIAQALAGQRLRDVPQGKHPFIVVMLKREGQTIIPDGNTLIYAGDEAVIATLAS